jgi:hypothetical protein
MHPIVDRHLVFIGARAARARSRARHFQTGMVTTSTELRSSSHGFSEVKISGDKNPRLNIIV